MTNPVLQETIIRTMEDVPEQLSNVYSKEILKAFFEKGNYLIMRIVPSGDTRFYLDSGKRVTKRRPGKPTISIVGGVNGTWP